MISTQMHSASSVALIILVHGHGKSSIQEEEEEDEDEDTSHRQTGLKFKGKKNSKLLDLENSFLSC